MAGILTFVFAKPGYIISTVDKALPKAPLRSCQVVVVVRSEDKVPWT